MHLPSRKIVYCEFCGSPNGVAVQIKRDLDERALRTHCYCHSLNLACGDCIRENQLMKNSFETSLEITKLVKKSPKRESHMKVICDYKGFEEHSSIRLFCKMNCSCRFTSEHKCKLFCFDETLGLVLNGIQRPRDKK